MFSGTQNNSASKRVLGSLAAKLPLATCISEAIYILLEKKIPIIVYQLVKYFDKHLFIEVSKRHL